VGEHASSKSERTDLWLKVAAGVLTVLTAGLTLLAAFLNQQKQNAQGQAVDLQNEKAELQRQTTSLRQTIEQLQLEVKRLQEQNGAPSGEGPATTGGSDATSPERRQGELTLASGTAADLDTLEANWGVRAIVSRVQGADIANEVGRLEMLTDGYYSIIGTKKPSYGVCAAATGYQQQIDFSDLERVTYLCARTEEERFARLQILEHPARASGLAPIKLLVTVWEKP
jgi:hypothetical protein